MELTLGRESLVGVVAPASGDELLDRRGHFVGNIRPESGHAGLTEDLEGVEPLLDQVLVGRLVVT